jgi:predicted nucleic acid-binding Zn ribbon protein
LLSSPAIQFKGSGWYITDYANGNGVKATESEKEAAASETSTTGTKTETQTTAKPAKDGAAKASPKVA